jgi:heme/copper-type cytochrome/quinol oxidase subunit 2
MNTITIIVTVLTLWLVMGLSFLSVYLEIRRKGKSPVDAWTSYEGLLFVASIAVPLILLIYRAASG